VSQAFDPIWNVKKRFSQVVCKVYSTYSCVDEEFTTFSLVHMEYNCTVLAQGLRVLSVAILLWPEKIIKLMCDSYEELAVR